jgi:hypothetical protein
MTCRVTKSEYNTETRQYTTLGEQVFEGELCNYLLDPQGVKIYEKIPQHYASYSLFLICSPEWIMRLYNDMHAFDTLYGTYRAFGEAIGQNNLAVWFWEDIEPSRVIWHYDTQEPQTTTAHIRYDIARAVSYCSKYKLQPSRSPYILVTTDHPDIDNSLENYFIVELGNLDERGSITVLSSLTDQIVAENLNQKQLDSASYWASWQSIFNRLMISLRALSDRIHVSLDTKFLKVMFGKPEEGDEAHSTVQ